MGKTSSFGIRIKGHKGVALRKARMARSGWLCELCLSKDPKIVKVASEVDHITPLAFGGEDIDSNTQNLCEDCHLEKTAEEACVSEAASNYPNWLKPSSVPITIVCGPPCAGKTTYIAQHAKSTDTVIDLDTILAKLRPGYVHWSGMLDRPLLNKAIRVRNAMLGMLHRKKRGRAWFIVSAPSEKERLWWVGKLGGSVLLLHPGIKECKERALKRGTPNAIDGINDWERKAKQPWLSPGKRSAKPTIGADGWAI